MPTYSAGEASVRIRPDASDFVRDLRAKLSAIRDPGFTITVDADTGQAKRDIAAFRAEEERRGVDVDVDVDVAGAATQMAAFRAAETARSLKIRVDVDTSQALAQITAVKAAASAGGRGGGVGGALLVNAGALGVGSFPAAATALTTLAGALQQVSQAGLVLPGVFAGAGASVGTLALGLSGMKDALEAVNEAADGTPESLAKANAAMSGLAPSARDVVKALADMKPQFDGLRQTVQGNLFAGVSEDLKTLVANDFPTLERGLSDISKGLNDNIRTFLQTAGSDTSRGLLDRILGNTAEAQSRFSNAIEPMITGLGTLTAAGTDALPRLADAFTAVMTRFRDFIVAADQDGRLAKWIDQGLDGMTNLGNSVLNIGKAFTAITSASGGAGSFLKWLVTATDQLQTFLNSTAGQDMLRQFFAEGREQLEKWWQVARNLPGIFGAIYDAAKAWTDALLPPLQKITEFLSEHADLVKTAAGAYVAWKSIEGVTSLVNNLTNLSTMLRTTLPASAAAGAASMSASLGPIAAIIAAAGVGIPVAFSGLRDALDEMAASGIPSPELSPVPVKPNTDDLGGLLGAPPAPPPPDPRAIQGPIPANPPGGPLDPGGVLGGTPGPVVVAPDDLAGLLGDPPKIPSRRAGGPTPTGAGRGPTGGFITELHPDEWVLPAHARKALGDNLLWALTRGRSFNDGGYIDEHGNPVTPGPRPGGPAPIAASPAGGGGVQAAIGNFVSGLSGPIGNAVALGQGLANLGSSQSGGIPGLQTQHGAGTIGAGAAQTASDLFGITALTQANTPAGDLASRFAQVPGLVGLFGGLASPDPVGSVAQWGGQTLNWLANWGTETAGSLFSTLWQGGLALVGLENSILSPSNPWNQAITGTAAGVLDQGGMFGPLMTTNADGAATDTASSTDLQRGAAAVAARRGTGSASPATAQLPGAPSRGARLTISQVDALAAKFGLTKTSGYRNEPGSFHSTGRAGDYGGAPQQMAQFASYMAMNYPGSLSELIHDSPGFTLNVDEGQYVGPFGQFYTLAQAGYHGDHVHIAVRATSGTGRTPRTGGPRRLGTGGPTNTISQAAAIRPVPTPPVQARQLNPRPTPTPPPRTANPRTPAPEAQSPAPPAAPSSPAQVAPPPRFPTPGATAVAKPTAAAPDDLDSLLNHNLPAVSTAINSGASALGQALSTAIGIASSLGAGAPIPGASAIGALGGLGSYAAGLVQQGGKVLEDAANVVSASLVGSVPGSGATTDSAYGETLRPQQRELATAGGGQRVASYGPFYGHDTQSVMREINLNESIHQQSMFANRAWYSGP